MHCNLRQPNAAQSLSALISSPMPSSKSLSLSVFTAYTLRYAVTLNFDPVTLTFDLWPWTFVVSRLCRSKTLYKIWAQSGNLRRSYCCLNFDLMTFSMYHVLPLCCGIVCTKFKLSRAIPSWHMMIFWRSCVMSRYDLDLWPVDLESLW